MKSKNLPVTQSPRQEVFEVRRMQAHPYNVWTTEMFANMVERICDDEIEAAVRFGALPPSRREHDDLRRIAIQNINAYAHPAGNA